ncbi:coproporphyrinogen-III oxidase family protein [Anaerosporobacter sp.]|uniref:coproporphyrinogen-III oxidase family protein n=1 Tax=Anaerosporobacter sp. TaxID=1872529 RepID=UPI00286F85C8|nr:radical SAM protein [Anaerosporobacter sp.]
MFKERIKTHHSAMGEGKQYLRGPGNVKQVLSVAEDDASNAVIYIHVPFCAKICTFCNMRRSLQEPSKEYADLIVEEIKEYSKLEYVKSRIFDAVYFGGGTPTTLSTADLTKILRALKESFQFTEDAEFTVETTVTQLQEEKWRTLIEEGINRFSVGIQTFNNKGRAMMGRIGSGETAYELLKALKQTDVVVSMDLIYNYSEQSMDDLYDDLDKMIELDLDGFSMYSLIDMKETKISEAQGQDNDEKMFFVISEHMEKAGYHFLELTKMVKRDSYRYIMNRHAGADTLPLGAGAGGSMHGLAMMNPIDIDEYRESIRNFDKRMGMQFSPDYKEVVCFKGDIQTIRLPRNTSLYKEEKDYQKMLEELIQNEMVSKVGDGFSLTKKGVYWGNTISRELYNLI